MPRLSFTAILLLLLAALAALAAASPLQEKKMESAPSAGRQRFARGVLSEISAQGDGEELGRLFEMGHEARLELAKKSAEEHAQWRAASVAETAAAIATAEGARKQLLENIQQVKRYNFKYHADAMPHLDLMSNVFSNPSDDWWNLAHDGDGSAWRLDLTRKLALTTARSIYRPELPGWYEAQLDAVTARGYVPQGDMFCPASAYLFGTAAGVQAMELFSDLRTFFYRGYGCQPGLRPTRDPAELKRRGQAEDAVQATMAAILPRIFGFFCPQRPLYTHGSQKAMRSEAAAVLRGEAVTPEGFISAKAMRGGVPLVFEPDVIGPTPTHGAFNALSAYPPIKVGRPIAKSIIDVLCSTEDLIRLLQALLAADPFFVTDNHFEKWHAARELYYSMGFANIHLFIDFLAKEIISTIALFPAVPGGMRSAACGGTARIVVERAVELASTCAPGLFAPRNPQNPRACHPSAIFQGNAIIDGQRALNGLVHEIMVAAGESDPIKLGALLNDETLDLGFALLNKTSTLSSATWDALREAGIYLGWHTKAERAQVLELLALGRIDEAKAIVSEVRRKAGQLGRASVVAKLGVSAPALGLAGQGAYGQAVQVAAAQGEDGVRRLVTALLASKGASGFYGVCQRKGSGRPHSESRGGGR
jgi:hypothetical protein